MKTTCLWKRLDTVRVLGEGGGAVGTSNPGHPSMFERKAGGLKPPQVTGLQNQLQAENKNHLTILLHFITTEWMIIMIILVTKSYDIHRDNYNYSLLPKKQFILNVPKVNQRSEASRSEQQQRIT